MEAVGYSDLRSRSSSTSGTIVGRPSSIGAKPPKTFAMSGIMLVRSPLRRPKVSAPNQIARAASKLARACCCSTGTLPPGSRLLLFNLAWDKAEMARIGRQSLFPVYLVYGNVELNIKSVPAHSILVALLPTPQLFATQKE